MVASGLRPEGTKQRCDVRLKRLTTPGTQQQIHACSGTANQLWTHNSSGQLAAVRGNYRVGGWAEPVHGPIEHEIATVALDGGKQR